MTDEAMTVGRARRLISVSRGGHALARSVVNPAMTHGQALDVLDKALAERPDHARLEGLRDSLLARNVLRECGQA